MPPGSQQSIKKMAGALGRLGRLASVLEGIAAESEIVTQTSRRIHTSSARCDVRKTIEGRFSRPGAPQQGGLGIPGMAGEEAAAMAESARALDPGISQTRRRIGNFFRVFLPVAGFGSLAYAFLNPDDEPLVPAKYPPHLQYQAAQKIENQEVLTNWSGTHEVRPKRYFQPEKESEVEAFVQLAHKAKQKLRVVGSGLSPNGVGFSDEGVLSMALMDKVIKVDKDKKQVTVQSGIRIQQLVEYLRPYGLTLQNYASIREQQVGGFTQVGAHGTGALLPPVEEQVVSMKLVTPALGTIKLDAGHEPELFNLAKCGLGALGVVSEVTLQCVPAHRLVEKTFVSNIQEVRKQHVTWLKDNKHLRYMWIPHTDTVVVVQCNPEDSAKGQAVLSEFANHKPVNDDVRLKPFRDLLSSRAPADMDVNSLSQTQLRDELLALDPLNKDWVSKVNVAEAQVWKHCEGMRTGWSDEILGFDCGGQQWVNEVAFPVGQLSELKGVTKDIQYMEQLLKEIQKNKVPAHSPIEQRWSAGSSAAMSPSSGPPGSVHSWVGIIMYLPHEPQARDKVTSTFHDYARMVANKFASKYNSSTHWAKLEIPPAEATTELQQVRARLAARFPLETFNAYRQVLDPNNILANKWVDTLLTP